MERKWETTKHFSEDGILYCKTKNKQTNKHEIHHMKHLVFYSILYKFYNRVSMINIYLTEEALFFKT